MTINMIDGQINSDITFELFEYIECDIKFHKRAPQIFEMRHKIRFH